MAQLQLPIFPNGTTEINANLAVEKREDQITYFYGHLPIFKHDVDDLPTFRMITSQICANGNAMDNGPECSGRRTQFLFRLKEFVDKTGLCVRIIYYPPYHCKYNSIERYWAGLEKSWNGYLLHVVKRAGNFFWKGTRTVTRFLNTTYEKGIKVCGNEKIDLEQRLQRAPVLRW